MLLQCSTWQEIENYLSKSSGIIIPVGSTEQHGPRGLLGTDFLCPEIIAHGIPESEGILIAPTLPFGIAQHHLGFAGTIAWRPSTLITVIEDMIHSFLKHGFSYFYFLNGHGGNTPTLQAAFSEIWHSMSLQIKKPDRLPQFKLANWWEYPEIKAVSQRFFGKAEGHHATPSELSLTYYAYPHAVKNISVSPDLAPAGPIRDAFDYRKRFPDGRIISNSNLANIEAGKILFETATAALVKDYNQFILASSESA